MKTLETPSTATAAQSQAQSQPEAQPGAYSPTRWIGTGRSVDSDARVAGAQAASAALQGRQASLLIVFCPAQIDIATMLEGVRAESGDAPMIGCSGTTQIEGTNPIEAAVVVSALGGQGFEIHTAVATDITGKQRAAGELIAEPIESLAREHKLLLLLCDGLTGDQHEVLRGAYGVVGAAVPMVGGCAADDRTYSKTFQFYSDADGDHVVTDAVVAASIGSDTPIGIGVAHGWRKVGEPMMVTSSDGGRLHTLDGVPALDVFLDRTGETRSITNDYQTFQEFALKHPLGLSRRSGEDIRVLSGSDLADGSMTCLADIPQGTLVWMMESDHSSLISSVDDAYDEALAALGDMAPLGFLAFDCIVRHVFLGQEGIIEETERLVDRAAGVPLGGFVTYGEVARIRGSRGMHYLTLVLVAFA